MTNMEKVSAYYSDRMFVEYTREAELLKLATEMLKMLDDCVIIRVVSATVIGVADLIVCYKGKFFAFETKKYNGVPSAAQLKFLASINASGGTGIVCKTLSEILLALEQAT